MVARRHLTALSVAKKLQTAARATFAEGTQTFKCLITRVEELSSKTNLDNSCSGFAQAKPPFPSKKIHGSFSHCSKSDSLSLGKSVSRKNCGHTTQMRFGIKERSSLFPTGYIAASFRPIQTLDMTAGWLML
jgi:hypothetical protein